MMIIIDHVYVIAIRRDNLTDGANYTSDYSLSRLLSTMMVQLDDILSYKPSADDTKILIIATTRSFSLLETSSPRPGRIDVHISASVRNRTVTHEIITQLLAKAAQLSVPVSNNKVE